MRVMLSLKYCTKAHHVGFIHSERGDRAQIMVFVMYQRYFSPVKITGVLFTCAWDPYFSLLSITTVDQWLL